MPCNLLLRLPNPCLHPLDLALNPRPFLHPLLPGLLPHLLPLQAEDIQEVVVLVQSLLVDEVEGLVLLLPLLGEDTGAVDANGFADFGGVLLKVGFE